MAAYRLRTLGTLGVETATGDAVEFPAGKPLALLLRLAVGPEPPTRRELVHLLWPRSSMERGLQSVRQALWLIRKTLGDDVLEANDVVTLRPGAVTCDVTELTRALDEGRVADAEALWRGPFLPRFAVADSAEWDHWVESVADSVSGRLASALYSATLGRRDAGDVIGARRGLERAAEVAPLDSRYREELVSFLVEMRDLRAAEQALAEARQALPEPEQRAGLEEQARRVEQLRAERTSVPDERLARPDLVGRSAELADLVAAWRRAQKGNKRIVLLTGPAGIGKTRLADELARTVQHEGAAVVALRATEVERGMEHGVIASLARALLQMPGAAGISTSSDTMLRGLAPSLPVRGTASVPGNGEHPNPVALADALADLIGAVAWERPVLITVDDAGWSDPASVSVLARALRTLREGAVLVVLTARTPGGVGGQLRPLESVGGDVAFGTIRLRPLSRAETQELVALLVDLPEGAGAGRLLDRIHATTGGNPFYVIELIRAFLDERLIATDDGGLALDLSRLDEQAPWPKSVRALVRRRFERMSPQARALGHLLATVTPREPEMAARRLVGLSRSAYGRAVGELVEHGIVGWDGNALAFTHAELREAAAAWVEEETTVPIWRRWSAGRVAGGIVLASAAVVLVALRVAGAGRPRPAPSPPFGGGTIVLSTGDSALAFRAERVGDSIRWSVSPLQLPAPGLDRLQVFRTASGELLWFRLTVEPGRGPDIVRVEPATGAQTPVVSGPGDESVMGVSPDGAWLAYGSDDPATPYDHGVHLARVDGSEPRVLRRGGGGFDWSRDGRHLLAAALAPVDTLLVMTPAGRVVGRRPGGRLEGYFCGSDRIVAHEWTDAGYRLFAWDWRTGAEKTLASNVVDLAACSPDGTGALVSVVENGREGVGVLDLESGRFHALEVGLLSGSPVSPAWLADGGPAVPSALALDPDSLEVDWGGTDSLGGWMTLSDGTRQRPAIAWSSADSGVATVSASGRLIGNRPGTTVVRGCVDDWICDTMRVRVGDRPTEDLLFDDHFPAVLDTAQWIPFGQPIPHTAMAHDGARVLLLDGDGVWVDGVLSRRAFSFALGATLELEFRYPPGLRRNDRQTARFCLHRYDLAGESPARLEHITEERTGDGVCFGYPADELTRFDPAVATFYRRPGTASSFARAAADLPPVSWTHVAIQILPDGQAFLFLNRRQVAKLPAHLQGTARDDWRILVSGHAVDTRLEVRYVTLWRRPRY